MQGGTSGGVPGNPFSGEAWGRKVGPERNPPPPTTWISPYVYDLFPLGGARRVILSGGVTGEGLDLEQPPGPLIARPHAGHDSGTGVGEL